MNNQTSKWTPEAGDLDGLINRYTATYELASMMAPPVEQAYCHWVAQQCFKGRGELVELGCFLGSLSRPLLNGLGETKEAAASQSTLQVYDRFLWDSSMDHWARALQLEKRPVDGGSFQFLYEQFMEGYLDRLKIHCIDFTVEKPPAETIEVLLVDVMKGFEITDNAAQAFFPKIIPGGLIIHQDYMNFAHGWIQVLTWRLRKHLRPVWVSPSSSMTAFEVISPIDEADCFVLESLPPPSPEIILEAYEWNRNEFPKEHEIVLEASEIFLLIMSGHGDTVGYDKYQAAKAKGWEKHHSFEHMIQFCKQWNFSWRGLEE
jgi:hypothetical protein